jgi:hypothetical protein
MAEIVSGGIWPATRRQPRARNELQEGATLDYSPILYRVQGQPYLDAIIGE